MHTASRKRDNTRRDVSSALQLSHCCGERSPALHTSAGPKRCSPLNETPREMLEYDEEITVAILFFLISGITQLGTATHITTRERKDRQREKESR